MRILNVKEVANKLFIDLVMGGQITMPLENTCWGDYVGMLTDKFEENWMISFNDQQQN